MDKPRTYVGIDEDSETMYKFRWLGIFKNEKIGLKNATPAQVLQQLLEKKWKLQPHDRDMIVMQHRFSFIKSGNEQTLTSSLVVKGDDVTHTAMAKTVGLPLAIAAKLILEKKINLTGVHIPVRKEIYQPVLSELRDLGVRFEEKIS